jgi:hypothetical protein
VFGGPSVNPVRGDLFIEQQNDSFKSFVFVSGANAPETKTNLWTMGAAFSKTHPITSTAGRSNFFSVN